MLFVTLNVFVLFCNVPNLALLYNCTVKLVNMPKINRPKSINPIFPVLSAFLTNTQKSRKLKQHNPEKTIICKHYTIYVSFEALHDRFHLLISNFVEHRSNIGEQMRYTVN